MTTRLTPVLALIPLVAMVTLGCGNDRHVIRKQTDTYRSAQPAPAPSGTESTTTVFKQTNSDEED